MESRLKTRDKVLWSQGTVLKLEARAIADHDMSDGARQHSQDRERKRVMLKTKVKIGRLGNRNKSIV